MESYPAVTNFNGWFGECVGLSLRVEYEQQTQYSCFWMKIYGLDDFMDFFSFFINFHFHVCVDKWLKECPHQH